MADTAAAQSPTTTVAPTAPLAVANRGAQRAERRAAAVAKIQAAQTKPEAPAPLEAAKPAEAPKPIEAKPAEKPAEATAEKPDPATDRGLRQIEQARKKFLDEQNAWKAERDAQLAEVARLRKEAEGKVTSKQELTKLSPTDLLEALEHFGEDDFDILSRAAYARTKAGKTDPRAQAAAQEASRAQGSRATASKVAEIEAKYEAKIAELEAKFDNEFKRRDQASFAEHWVGEAVKAIPADKPTFLSKLHANEPDKARRELLTIGAELEKANDGEPPTQAEVIEEFEKRKRAELASLGLDADALLSPPAPAKPAPAPAPMRTLSTTATSMTRVEDAPRTREERRAIAFEKLRASKRALADQT